jgi:hypothetical protein
VQAQIDPLLIGHAVLMSVSWLLLVPAAVGK